MLRQCQSLRRVNRRLSVTAWWWWTATAWDVPPLPAGTTRAVGEVDLLAVEPVALVEAAELVEQLSAEERKAPSSQSESAGSVGCSSSR